MADDWKERMQAANDLWLQKRATEYPIRVELPEASAKSSLSIANDLNVPFAHCKLPISGVQVFLFKSQSDADAFAEAMKGRGNDNQA